MCFLLALSLLCIASVDHILILHARQLTTVSSTFVHFSSNRFQPNQSIQLRRITHHPTTTMSSEEKKKSGISSKSTEANQLRAELAKGLHGDINKVKGISWKKVHEGDPDYNKYNYESFCNLARAIRKELVALEVAKRQSQRMKDTREKVAGELIAAAPSSSHAHSLHTKFYSSLTCSFIYYVPTYFFRSSSWCSCFRSRQ